MRFFDCIFDQMSFQTEIICWYHTNKRDLPWRNSTDAYVIWLSEIILQQTRVEQGLPYFNRFLENFPTVKDFAQASETQILKLWQGLGYYSRGRNMLFTAKQIMQLHNGVFPTDYKSLIKLKGIGDYTAAAISSFSSNEEKAVLDGNVFRVLSRYYGLQEPINSTQGVKMFAALAQQLIVQQQPSVYNQAIMEFGALQCKPKSPLCGNCPLQLGCFAYANHKVDQLPVKLKKIKTRVRWFNYFVAIDGDYILAKQRESGDVWQHLYDFPLIETDSLPAIDQVSFLNEIKVQFGHQAVINLLYQKKHLLTHQTIYVQFFALHNYMPNLDCKIKSFLMEDFKELPHPKVISEFVETHINSNQI